VLITDTAFTAPGPGSARDIAVNVFTAITLFVAHRRVSDLSRAPGD
jgi:hypothetical protein